MPENPHARRLLRMFGGMLFGLAIVGALTASGALQQVVRWRPEEIVSTVLAGMLMTVALITGGFATSRHGYRALTDDGLGEPVEPAMLSMLRRQALATGLLGLLLLVPPAAAHAGLTGAAVAAPVAALLLVLGGITWLHVGLERDSDELARAVSRQSGAASFTVAGLALFGWAALEKLALLPALDSWTQLTALMAIAIAVSTVISVRRGLVGR